MIVGRLASGIRMRYSIVMPIYNVENFLRDSVSDILCQFVSDFELILVDDCSTDSSGKICDELESNDKRIRVLHLPENGGLSNARNQGLDVANGEYIMFLDPDDRYDISLLTDIEESLRKNPATVVVFGLTEVYFDKTGEIQYTEEIMPKAGCFRTAKEVREQVLPLENKTLFGYAWNKVYKLSYLREQKLQFQTITMIEDVLFNIEVFRDLDSLNLIETPYYYYAIRQKGSLTTKYLPNYFELHEKRIESLCRLLRSWGMESPENLQELGGIYCRYFLSALQRNCSKKANMSHSDRRKWVQKQFKSETYRHMKPFLHPKNRMLKVIAWGIRTENTSLCLLMGRGVYFVKEKCPDIFSRLKQNR